ncbi:MAG: hypothetical protein KZQ83_08895 [gamma proteobacterium symbiont of Taylorina sp.]|nr:hypothetical protein [gamma proteobacterium symbiont of Taylorina sp.]
MDEEISNHGTHNEAMEDRTGYCQAVSGLCEMTDEYDQMFTTEGRYWCQFKKDNPNLWQTKLSRLKLTRGTIFVNRLLKCIKWLDRNILLESPTPSYSHK